MKKLFLITCLCSLASCYSGKKIVHGQSDIFQSWYFVDHEHYVAPIRTKNLEIKFFDFDTISYAPAICLKFYMQADTTGPALIQFKEVEIRNNKYKTIKKMTERYLIK